MGVGKAWGNLIRGYSCTNRGIEEFLLMELTLGPLFSPKMCHFPHPRLSEQGITVFPIFICRFFPFSDAISDSLGNDNAGLWNYRRSEKNGIPIQYC